MILGTLKYLNYKYKLLLYNFAENDKSDFASLQKYGFTAILLLQPKGVPRRQR